MSWQEQKPPNRSLERTQAQRNFIIEVEILCLRRKHRQLEAVIQH